MDPADKILIRNRLYSGTLVFLPFLFLAVIRWFFDFNGLYGQDAHRYFQYIQELEAFFANGSLPGEFHWPVLYPLSGLILKWVFGIHGALALQLISSFSLGVGSLFLFKILKGSAPRAAFVFTFLFMLLAPQILMAGVLCMSDLFSVMWVVLSWYFYRQFATEGLLGYALALSATAALASISRYPVFLIVVFPVAFAFFRLVSRRSWYALLMPVLFLLFCLPELLIQPTAGNLSGNYFLQNWSFQNFFSHNFETLDGSQQYRFANWIYITYPFWHPAYFFAGAFYALYAFFRFRPGRLPWLLIVVSIAVYLLFIGGLPMQARRFFMPVFPLILILVYECGLGNWLQGLKRKFLLMISAMVVIFQLVVTGYYGRDYLRLNRFERELAADLEPYQGNKLYAFYWNQALKSYDMDFEFYNLWQKPYNSFSTGDLVLFDPGGLKEQWEGHTLMKNWESLRESRELKLLEKWPNGWKLYEVQ